MRSDGLEADIAKLLFTSFGSLLMLLRNEPSVGFALFCVDFQKIG